MNQEALKKYSYIQELLDLEIRHPDRFMFHDAVKPLLLRMGADKAFLRDVIRRNFDDAGYLKQEWSLYNIPYFHVYETDDFILKIHLFPAAEKYEPGQAAHAIHHHNNYILTTNAFFGSGYESMLFDTQVVTNPKSMRTAMKESKHFHQRDWNPSRVNPWEPHVVFIPEALSATMLIWTPDKKRTTDALRNMGLLKAIKKPLRLAIQMLGLESTFGIAKSNTYQYYPAPDGEGFMAIEEEEYFAPTKAAKGKAVDDYSMQMIFSFLQKADLIDIDYFNELIQRFSLPDNYKIWVTKVLNKEDIAEVFHRTELNIPQKSYKIADIRKAFLYQANPS